MSDFESGVGHAQRMNHYVLKEALCGAEVTSLQPDPTLEVCPDCARIHATIPTEPREPVYQWQVFDTKRSRVVMEVPAEDVDGVRARKSIDYWVLRRRVVGPWEEVQ